MCVVCVGTVLVACMNEVDLQTISHKLSSSVSHTTTLLSHNFIGAALPSTKK